MEEVAVVAGGDLRFHSGNGEFFHPQFVQNLRQNGLDALQYQVLMLGHVHENTGAAVFIVNDAAIRTGRNDLAGAEVGFVFQREAHEAFQFLGSQKLIQNHTLRWQDRRPLRDGCTRFRHHRGTNGTRRLGVFWRRNNRSIAQRTGWWLLRSADTGRLRIFWRRNDRRVTHRPVGLLVRSSNTRWWRSRRVRWRLRVDHGAQRLGWRLWLKRRSGTGVGVRRSHSGGIGQRYCAVLQNTFDDASAEHRESALSYGFAHGRRNDRSDGFLRLLALAGHSLGMLQQSGD